MHCYTLKKEAKNVTGQINYYLYVLELVIDIHLLFDVVQAGFPVFLKLRKMQL